MRIVQPGLVHYASFSSPESLRPSLEMVMADPFFQVVELSSSIPSTEIDWIRECAQIAGKKVCLSGASQLGKMQGSLHSQDQAIRNQALTACRGMVDLAYAVDAISLMLCSGKDPGPDHRPVEMALLAESLAQLCSYARSQTPQRRKPIVITVEPFDRACDRRRLLGPTSEAVSLWHQLRQEHTNISITPDLSHIAQLGEDPLESLSLFGDGLTHLHVATCVLVSGHRLFGDQHPGFDTPDLALSTDQAAAAVRAAASAGTGPLVVSVEVKPGGTGRDALAEYQQTRRDFAAILASAGVLNPA